MTLNIKYEYCSINLHRTLIILNLKVLKIWILETLFFFYDMYFRVCDVLVLYIDVSSVSMRFSVMFCIY